ncbi:MAG TPA: GNAT family N-acetyltransferase, partial [Stellaceae bacterium]|nr:GNAT family N-acetyltransferase [Stellaceae bacterium]
RAFAQMSAENLYELLRFRQAIFVVEQRCAYPDLDSRDREAAHLLLRRAGELCGCLRVIPVPAEIRIGRVAVAAPLRRRGLARRMMEEALAFCRASDPGAPVVLSAQLHLVDFYRGFGFAPVGAPYDDYGIMHLDMKLEQC